MASSAQLRRLQDIIEYNFTRIEYLEEALTAAGADEDNYDGNRKLSQLGELLIQCVLLFTAHTGGASRSEFRSRSPASSMLTLIRRCK